MGMGIHQRARNSKMAKGGELAQVEQRKGIVPVTKRDDRFRNKNRQPDRSSRYRYGRVPLTGGQSEQPNTLMYSNVSGSSVYVLTLQIVPARP